MTPELAKRIAYLRQSIGGHIEIAHKMLHADGGAIFPLDILAVATLNRSVNLVAAFTSLVEARNFVVAAPLLRLQIDNCLRFYAAWIADNCHDFATKVMKGVAV